MLFNYLKKFIVEFVVSRHDPRTISTSAAHGDPSAFGLWVKCVDQKITKLSASEQTALFSIDSMLAILVHSTDSCISSIDFMESALLVQNHS